jgi:hypothetical protein
MGPVFQSLWIFRVLVGHEMPGRWSLQSISPSRALRWEEVFEARATEGPIPQAE